MLPRISCPFIIRGRHNAVANLRDTSLYEHTRPEILLPADDEEEEDDEVDDGNTSVPTSGDAEVEEGVNKADSDGLEGLRLPNLDGSSMKFLHQVIHCDFS